MWNIFAEHDATKFPHQVAYENLFAAEGSYLQIADYPADVAVAISDSLFGTLVEVSMTCNQSVVVAEEDSCVQFYLNFTNSRCAERRRCAVGCCGQPCAVYCVECDG